jgi:hypothetical protein
VIQYNTQTRTPFPADCFEEITVTMRTLSLMLCSLSASSTVLAAAAGAQEEIRLVAPGWIQDYEEGLRQARQTGKPIFAVIR